MANTDYSICSHDPSAVWADPQIFGNRIDPSYYSAQYLELDDKFQNHKDHSQCRLGSLLVAPRRTLYLKTESFDKSEGTEGRIPFISGVDIDENVPTIKWDQPKFVDNWMAEKYPKGILFPEALIIKVKGPNQLAAYIENPPYEALVSGTCLLSKIENVHPYYLVTFLICRYAQKWRTRLRQNITVEFTPYEELAEIPIILPGKEIQTAIGAKVQKALKLNFLVSKYESLLKNQFEAYLADYSDSIKTNLSWIVSEKKLNHRLDPSANHIRLLELRECLSRTGLTKTIGEIVENKFPVGKSFSDFSKIGPIYVRIADFDYGTWDDSAAHISKKEHLTNSKAELKNGDIVFARIGNTIGKVGYADTRAPSASISNNCTLLRAKQHVSGAWLFWALRSRIGQVQVDCLKGQTAQPKLNHEDIANIIVPVRADFEQREVSQKTEEYFSFHREQIKLVNDAKSDVEALIDGTLDIEKLLSEGQETKRWLKENPSSNN